MVQVPQLCRSDEQNKMYFVYILKCADSSLYTGITTNLVRRFQEHKNKIGSHYTTAKKAVKIVYSEKKRNRSTASKRETEIKSWTRQKKIDLIESANFKM